MPEILTTPKTCEPASSGSPSQTCCASLKYGDPVEIQTGEMDDPERHRFVMRIGGNGDLYLEVCPKSKRFSTPVHIVTSGGHNTQMPEVTQALFHLYNALYKHSLHNVVLSGADESATSNANQRQNHE